MTDKRMKVIDRRMFTPDGELRDEYKDTVDPDRTPEPAPAEPNPTHESEPADVAEPAQSPIAAETAPEPVSEPAPAESAEPEAEDPNHPAPRFTDLVAFLAQTAAAYLQQARQGAVGGAMSAADMLEMARMQVDLLDVLEKKTTGNLTAEEHAILDDARRQLRLALG